MPRSSKTIRVTPAMMVKAMPMAKPLGIQKMVHKVKRRRVARRPFTKGGGMNG